MCLIFNNYFRPKIRPGGFFPAKLLSPREKFGGYVIDIESLFSTFWASFLISAYTRKERGGKPEAQARLYYVE